jgi:hypothetical protein
VLVAHLVESKCGMQHDLLKVESRWNYRKIRLIKRGVIFSLHYWHFFGISLGCILALLW